MKGGLIVDLPEDNEDDEKRIINDDVAVRSARDANNDAICRSSSKRVDFDKAFNLPDSKRVDFDKAFNCSSHYAWMEPDQNKYRSRFLPMRSPDLVNDDLAYRRFRRSRSSEPGPRKEQRQPRQGRKPRRTSERNNSGIEYRSQERPVDVDEAISKSAPDLRQGPKRKSRPFRNLLLPPLSDFQIADLDDPRRHRSPFEEDARSVHLRHLADQQREIGGHPDATSSLTRFQGSSPPPGDSLPPLPPPRQRNNRLQDSLTSRARSLPRHFRILGRSGGRQKVADVRSSHADDDRWVDSQLRWHRRRRPDLSSPDQDLPWHYRRHDSPQRSR